MRRAFVIGDPIAHSRSPMIHGHWISRHAIQDATYEAIRVDADDLANFIAGLRSDSHVGGNVTIPHKEAVMGLADIVTQTARIIGAANTLIVDCETGTITADNTDARGFAANLDQQAGHWRSGRTALVIGAGGAARAILVAIREAGYRHIILANRTLSRATERAAEFSQATTSIEAVLPESISDRLAEVDLLVNTSSMGMKGANPLDIDFRNANPRLVVNDIVYDPLETRLLANAREAGLWAVDGLGMLLHQAVPGFAAWFGITPQVDDDLRSRIVSDLMARQ